MSIKKNQSDLLCPPMKSKGESDFTFRASFNPNQCGLFGPLRRRGGGQNDPLRDSRLWTLQFWYWSNKHCFIWKLASSAKIWDLIEVAEAHSLASGGIGSDRGQMKKIWVENPKNCQFLTDRNLIYRGFLPNATFWDLEKFALAKIRISQIFS